MRRIIRSRWGRWAAGLFAGAVGCGVLAYAERAGAAPVPFPTPRPAEAGPGASVPFAGPDKGRENGSPALAPAPPEPPQWSAAEIAAADACLARLAVQKIVFRSLPTTGGPGVCGALNPIQLDAVMDKDDRRIALTPAPTLRCGMAEALIHWLREDVAPAVAEWGGQLKELVVASSFECRGRNRVPGAQLSEHGLANAVDVSGFVLTDGKRAALTDAAVDKRVRERLRDSACARFTTVLGPGSDGYHESHIHLDVKERRGGYRLCQWDVRDLSENAVIPMPRERPAAAGSD